MNRHGCLRSAPKGCVVLFGIIAILVSVLIVFLIGRSILWNIEYERSAFVVLPSDWNSGGSISFSENGSLLAISLQPKGTLIWDLHKGEPIQFLSGPEASNTCSLSPDGKYLSQSSYYHLRILDRDSAEIVWQQTGDVVGLSKNWGYAYRLKDNQIEIFENADFGDSNEFRRVSTFSPKSPLQPEEPISRVILLPDGKSIPLYYTDNHAETNSSIYDLKGHVIQQIPWITGHRSGGVFMAFSQNEQWMVLPNDCIFNLKGGRITLSKEIDPRPNVPRRTPLTGISISNDASTVLITSSHVQYFIDLKRKRIQSSRAAPYSFGEVQISPCGNYSVTTPTIYSSEQHPITAQFWDIETGRELARLFYNSRTSDWLVIAPDHRYDGSPNARKILMYRENGKEKAPPDDLYTPGLLKRILDAKNLSAN